AHPIRQPITDDLPVGTPLGDARNGTYGRSFLRLVCSPDTQSPVTPERTERLTDTQDGLAARHPAGAREDVFIVFAQRLDTILIEVEIERRLPTEHVIGHRRATQHQFHATIGDGPDIIAH